MTDYTGDGDLPPSLGGDDHHSVSKEVFLLDLDRLDISDRDSMSYTEAPDNYEPVGNL